MSIFRREPQPKSDPPASLRGRKYEETGRIALILPVNTEEFDEADRIASESAYALRRSNIHRQPNYK